MARTECPASTSASQRWEPTKPEAPVTVTVSGTCCPVARRSDAPRVGRPSGRVRARLVLAMRHRRPDPQRTRVDLCVQHAALALDVAVHLVRVLVLQADLHPLAGPDLHVVVLSRPTGQEPEQRLEPVARAGGEGDVEPEQPVVGLDTRDQLEPAGQPAAVADDADDRLAAVST